MLNFKICKSDPNLKQEKRSDYPLSRVLRKKLAAVLEGSPVSHPNPVPQPPPAEDAMRTGFPGARGKVARPQGGGAEGAGTSGGLGSPCGSGTGGNRNKSSVLALARASH